MKSRLDDYINNLWTLKLLGGIKLAHIYQVQVRRNENEPWVSFQPQLKDGTDSYMWIALNPALGFYDAEMMRRDEPWLIVRYVFIEGAPVNLARVAPI